jgi:hypothetical protein
LHGYWYIRGDNRTGSKGVRIGIDIMMNNVTEEKDENIKYRKQNKTKQNKKPVQESIILTHKIYLP